MSWKGSFAAGDTLDFKFTTRRFNTGVPFTLAGSPAVSVYKSNSTTQSTSGVALTVDFDAVTGLNHVRVDTTADGTFYANGSQFDVVITAGTVDSVSVVGETIGRFELRTAVATAAALATVQADTDDIQARLPAALTANGNIKCSLMEILATALTETSGQLAGGFKKFFNIAAPASTMDVVARVTLTDTVTTYTGNTPQTGDAFARLGAPAGASLSADVAAVKADSAAVKTKTDFLPSATAGAAGGLFIAGANAATSITTALTANIIGNVTGNLSGSVGSVTGLTAANLDVAVSTRLAASSYTAPDNAGIAAVQAKTDNLPSDPADESLIIAATDAIMARVGAPVGASISADVAAVKTDAAAIKAKTDNLPGDPADASDIAAAFSTVNGTLATIAGYIDTEVGAIKAVTDKLDDTLEDSGSDGYIFSALALSLTPSTGGDPWATTLPGAYGAGTAGKIVGDALDAAVSTRATPAQVATELATYDGPTNAELATALAAADDAVLAAIGGVPTATENADALLNRDMAAVSDTNTRSPLNALRNIRNGFTIAGTTLTVLKEDDVTAAYTRDLTTDAAAVPITGVS